ncbi:MAG: HIT domain-containing protein, partial [Actinobacteria bacterium]|nr:HIT domain-containing protein [Actinomycetota bacterium]
PYVESAAGETAGNAEDCVFCRILASDEPGERTYVVRRDDRCAVVLNAYPYTSGHLMVMPVRHVGELEELRDDEAGAVWASVTEAVRALKAAYHPDGLNLGANLGRPAGAGVPGHFHVHVLPRWSGDTNFLTTVAESRVLPEALPSTYQKVRAVWPDL